MVKNPFKAKTKEENTREVVDKAKILQECKELETLGQDLLADGRYAKYREKFDGLLRIAINNLLVYNQPNNDLYSAEVRQIVQQIRDLLAFLNAPVNFLNFVETKRLNLTEGGQGE